MAALADVFAAIRLQLDGTGFEAQALALADKSGKNVGDRLSSNLSQSIKTAGLSAVGAGLGLAFGVAAAGAKELDDAVAKFTAQTGLAGEEAKVFGANTQALFASNVQGWAEIGDALTGIQVHFKITGDAAQKLGGQFLDFSRVAGGTAAESVNRFDELVNSGVISQGEMAVTMDKLIKSHQKFGVPINETIAALVKFAPAMHAAGLSTDDAIGLMNMFTESGLNAEASTKAFSIALQKVKSPAELQTLIAKISATEDPFTRASLAADLFGEKAGVQIANALKPGSGGIEAWSVSLAEATGATQKAGDALDSSFGNQATLMLHQFGAALAGIGTNFGPLLMATAVLGPKILVAITTALGGLAGVMFGQGTAAGASLVAGEAGAVAAGGPAVAGAVAATTGEVSVAARVLGIAAGAAFAAGIVAAGLVLLAPGFISLQDHLNENNKLAEQSLNAAEIRAVKWSEMDEATRRLSFQHGYGQPEDYEATLKSAIAKMDAAVAGQITADAPEIGNAVQAGIEALVALYTGAGKTAIAQAAKDGYVGIPTAMQAAQFEAGLALQKGIDDTISKIKSSRSDLLSAATDAADATLRPMEIAREKKNLLGEIESADLKRRLNSNNELTRNLAREELADLQAKDFNLLAEEATYGTTDQKLAKLNGLLHSQYYLDGLKSKDPDAVLYWQDFGAKTQTQIDVLNGIMNTGGANAAAALKAGFDAAIKDGTWAVSILSGMTITTGLTTPPITKKQLPKDYAGFAAGTPFVAQSGSYWVGERGPEVVNLPQGAAVTPNSALGGVTNIFNFPHYVGSRSELTKAIAQELRLVGG
jgi:hypothetical protein